MKLKLINNPVFEIKIIEVIVSSNSKMHSVKLQITDSIGDSDIYWIAEKDVIKLYL